MNEAEQRTIRVATYNVHGCVGTDAQRSEARIAEVIAELAVDVVGLQEIDSGRARSSGADQAALIARELGWHYHFQVAMEQADGRFGDAIISRYPLAVRRAMELPGRAPWYCRETRGAVCVTAETELGAVDIINTHLGLGGRERWLQAQVLTSAEWIASSDAPLILLGDFNSVAWSRASRLLRRKLRNVRSLVAGGRRLRTFPTSLAVMALDHIFVNAALHPVSAAVHRSPLSRVASDHYPLVAELTRAGG